MRRAKRRGKKAAKKRALPAGRKPARRAAAKRRAKQPAAKRAAARSRRAGAAKPRRAATPHAPKRSARNKPAPAKRPKLTVVRRAAPRRSAKPAAGPFAKQKAGASPKDLVLFELVRARVAVHGAIQGLSSAAADQPTAPGRSSSREMILRLAHRDRELLPTLEKAFLHNQRPNVPDDHERSADPQAVASLAHLDWESAKRLLQSSRELLLETLQSLPEEPSDRWEKGGAVRWICDEISEQDRRHAELLREARERRERLPQE